MASSRQAQTAGSSSSPASSTTSDSGPLHLHPCKNMEDFEEYAEKVKALPESTSNEDKLILYGLFKQATVGVANTARPGMFNMRERAKWDAWEAVKDKSKEEAMNDYITKVKQLQEEAAAAGAC